MSVNRDGREDAFDVDFGAFAGQELCDLIDDRVAAGDDGEVAAGKFDEGRAGDVVGEVATVFDRSDPVFARGGAGSVCPATTSRVAVPLPPWA